MDTTEGTAVMDEATMKRIIVEQGYRSYVYVYALGDGVVRSLGKFEDIAQMSEEELRAHIAAKFAQSSSQEVRKGDVG